MVLQVKDGSFISHNLSLLFSPFYLPSSWDFSLGLTIQFNAGGKRKMSQKEFAEWLTLCIAGGYSENQLQAVTWVMWVIWAPANKTRYGKSLNTAAWVIWVKKEPGCLPRTLLWMYGSQFWIVEKFLLDKNPSKVFEKFSTSKSKEQTHWLDLMLNQVGLKCKRELTHSKVSSDLPTSYNHLTCPLLLLLIWRTVKQCMSTIRRAKPLTLSHTCSHEIK